MSTAEAIRKFHREWGSSTPLHALPGDLYIKDESARFGLNAYKILGASWALHKLNLSSGTIASATAGNHGRAVAYAARKLGLNCVIYIPAAANPVRVSRIASEGATIVPVDGDYEAAVSRCMSDSRENGWTLVQDLVKEDYRQIPEWIIEGYSTLFAETDEQLPVAPATLALHMGGGNFAEAGLRRFRSRCRVIVAQPEPNNRTMDCLTVAEPSIGLLTTGVDEWVTISDEEARRAVEILAAHGISSSPSGAAGVAAILQTNAARPAVAVVTEGSLR